MWPEKNGKTWRIRELINGKKQTLEYGFATKTAAKEAITQLKADKLRGVFVDPRAGQASLSEVAREWWRLHKKTLGEETIKSEGRRLENHIIALLGEFPIGEIDDKAVGLWIEELEDPEDEERKPLAPKTIRNCHGVLYAFMQWCVDTHKIPINPCRVSKLPKITRKEMRFLSTDEIARLLSLIPLFWRPLVLFLIATGARFGEAIAIKAKTLDKAKGTVRIERAVHELPYVGLVETVPKTRFSMRTIGIPGVLMTLLVPLLVGKSNDDYVFLSPKGRTIRYSGFLRMWYKATKETEFDGLRIHDLRHTHASQLIAKNRPLTAIQRRLGHSSIQITSDLYGHLLHEVDEGMIAAVEESLLAVDFARWERELEDAESHPNESSRRGIVGESSPKQPGIARNNPEQEKKNPRSEVKSTS